MITPQGMINLIDIYGSYIIDSITLKSNKFGMGYLIGVQTFAQDIQI